MVLFFFLSQVLSFGQSSSFDAGIPLVPLDHHLPSLIVTSRFDLGEKGKSDERQNKMLLFLDLEFFFRLPEVRLTLN